MFWPDLIVYVAGADPYYEDQLGRVVLTFQGLLDRDRYVIETTVTGGCAVNVEDTITIHANAAAVPKEVLQAHAFRPG
jgi:acetoin utilization deacetylase AcuC-like enzyme